MTLYDWYEDLLCDETSRFCSMASTVIQSHRVVYDHVSFRVASELQSLAKKSFDKYRTVRMTGEVTSAIQLCKDIHSSISQVKQTLFGNKKQQCEDLCNDISCVKYILKDLKKKINVNTDPDRPQSLSDYGIMKLNVANSLWRADALSIATIFNFSAAYIEELESKTVPGISLIGSLEQHGILGESKVDQLEKALRKVNREVAVQHVLRYKESLPIPESSLASEGLLGIVQKTHTDLQKILTDVSGDRLKKSQLRKRRKLGKVISASNKSLQEANETLIFAAQCYQYRPDNPPSSGTVTDDSRGHETTDDALNERVERPRFKEISGIIQPHDVITFNNQIFILMDGGICAYNMAGKRIRRYQEDGFKPFAATFLDASLFVTDKKSKCVLKFDESLNVKKRFGKSNMTEPAGITSCETRKWIYVLTGRKRESAEVAKFTSDGEYLRCYCSDSLEDPWYIKKSSSDEFFISDFARKAVDIYSSDFSNRLYTVNTYKHCRGMDIDDEGNIYIALRDPGYKAQYECFVCYSRPTNGWVTIEESPKPWFWLNQNKSLDFVRGLHYYRCQDNKFLMFADPGNKRLKVISL
ncbi:uncharacterized protein [Apostichopus japonicus]|uniref:uncharacterized protein isoform X1 n=1 Tax=Stichopus japonicus TaxID=307972 RepID=UPI003AB61265